MLRNKAWPSVTLAFEPILSLRKLNSIVTDMQGTARLNKEKRLPHLSCSPTAGLTLKCQPWFFYQIFAHGIDSVTFLYGSTSKETGEVSMWNANNSHACENNEEWRTGFCSLNKCRIIEKEGGGNIWIDKEWEIPRNKKVCISRTWRQKQFYV